MTLAQKLIMMLVHVSQFVCHQSRFLKKILYLNPILNMQKQKLPKGISLELEAAASTHFHYVKFKN